MAPLGSFYQLILTDLEQDNVIKNLYSIHGWPLRALVLSEQAVKTLLQNENKQIVDFIQSTISEPGYHKIKQEAIEPTNQADADAAGNMITDDFVVVKTELDLFDEPINVRCKPESENERELEDELIGIDSVATGTLSAGNKNSGVDPDPEPDIFEKAICQQQSNSDQTAADLYRSNLSVDPLNETPSVPPSQTNYSAKVQHLYDQYVQVSNMFYSTISQMRREAPPGTDSASMTAINTVQTFLKTLLTAKEAINSSFTSHPNPKTQEKPGSDVEKLLLPQSTSRGTTHTTTPSVSIPVIPPPPPYPGVSLPVSSPPGVSLPISSPPNVGLPISSPPTVSLPVSSPADANLSAASRLLVSVATLHGSPLPALPGTYIAHKPFPRNMNPVKPAVTPVNNTSTGNHPSTMVHLTPVNNAPTKTVGQCGPRKQPKPINANVKTDFQCEHCRHYYASSRGLRKHYYAIHPDKTPPPAQPVCHTCKKEFKTRDELTAHRKETQHRSWFSLHYQCKQCGEYLSGLSVLEKHNSIPHREKDKFPCDICGIVLSNPLKWSVHKRDVHEPTNCTCDFCGKEFDQVSSMMSHRRRHFEANKKFVCEHCGKSFFNKGSLNFHVRIHTGYKPYTCRFCDYTSSWQGNIRKHEKIHDKTTSEEQEDENIVEDQ